MREISIVFIKERKLSTKYVGDMFFRYEKKILYIILRFFKKRKVLKIPLSKEKCMNPYRG